MELLEQQVEALIFVSNHAITRKEIREAINEAFSSSYTDAVIDQVVDDLITKYQSPEFALEIVEISQGLRFMTKGAYHHIIATYLKQTSNQKLTKAAMETLSIIAYKQPVMKSEVEAVRGVGCDYTIQKLIDKELVEIVGRDDGPGRPLLYGTSEKFMDYFGLRSVADLPKIQEIVPEGNTIGDIDETYDINDYKPEEE